MNTTDFVDTFKREGFIKHGPVLQRKDLTIFSDLLNTICTGVSLFPSVDISYEPSNKNVVRKIRNLAQNEPLFMQLATDERITALVSPLLGPNIALHSSIAWMKPPKVGSIKRPHQDAAYWRHIKPDDFVVVWIAIDDSTLENGCMNFYPQTHHGGILHHKSEPELHIPPEILAEYEPVPVPVPAGWATIHDGKTIHFTQDNHSSCSRRAVSMAFFSADSLIDRTILKEEINFPVVAGPRCGQFL